MSPLRGEKPIFGPVSKNSCTGIIGTTVGFSKFTDQDYADDAVLFSDCPSKWPYILSSFDEAAHTMGLNTSWSKTKIQNLGHGVTPVPVQLQGHVVESTDRFTYLGSDIHSSERSTPEILRRIVCFYVITCLIVGYCFYDCYV